jgi:hypothetical protein
MPRADFITIVDELFFVITDIGINVGIGVVERKKGKVISEGSMIRINDGVNGIIDE